jgi:hypothetical protein
MVKELSVHACGRSQGTNAVTESGKRIHPPWEEFKSFLLAEDPTLHVIDGKPAVSIFLEPGSPRIGLRTQLASGTFITQDPLAEIDIRTVSLSGESLLEISTQNQSLFPYFYSLALSIADHIQVEGVGVARAVQDSLEQWRALLSRASMLSTEEQTGLMGELWMLDRLGRVFGEQALTAWTGPKGQAHDFRIGSQEFEIKTTRSERRIHLIGSLSQLLPSPGKSLFLLSLQFAAAGATGGWSLNDSIVEVRSLFAPLGLASTFEEMLRDRYGVGEDNRTYYRERLQLRSKPYLVPVDDHLPVLRSEDILSIPRSGMERISDVRYRLDVGGLGFPEDSPEFLALLPRPPVSSDA